MSPVHCAGTLHPIDATALRKINAWLHRPCILSYEKDAQQMSHTRLTKITLNLARTKAFPDGSIRHGYEFVAPLDESGHIDTQTWKDLRNACIVHRFWGDEPVKRGFLVHRPGGDKGATWGFDYNSETHADDESGFRFGEHVFKIGEYVSIRDPDDGMETYRIAAMRPA
jgi:hypothetical protein